MNTLVPEMFEYASQLSDVQCLGSAGLNQGVFGCAIFQGEFEEAYKQPEPHIHTVVAHLSGPKVHWIDGDGAGNTVSHVGGISIDPNDVSRRGSSTGYTRFLHLYLGAEPLTQLADDIHSSGKTLALHPKVGANHELIAKLAEAMTSRLLVGTALSTLELDTIGHLIGLQLINDFSNFCGERSPELSQGLSNKSLSLLVDYVESYIGQDLSLSRLADVVGLSPYHFSRSFKAAKGIAPYAYVLQRRLAKVEILLADPDVQLSDVAIDTGFSSQQHMTSAFRKHAGVTPGRYRQKLLAEKSELSG